MRSRVIAYRIVGIVAVLSVPFLIAYQTSLRVLLVDVVLVSVFSLVAGTLILAVCDLIDAVTRKA